MKYRKGSFIQRLKFNRVFIIFTGIIMVSCIFISIYYRVISNKPNILLITIDTLRPDHLGCYGYQRNTSPNIDNLAKEGVVFLNCFVTAPSTYYVFPAFFTGKYLGIEGKSVEEDILLNNYLDKKFNTLAEYLKSSGYHTLAFVANSVLTIGRGFEQGFDYYKNYKTLTQTDAELITTDILGLLNSYRDNRPLFIWIHYLDPHAPYNPHPEYFKIFENDSLYQKKDKRLKLKPKASYKEEMPQWLINMWLSNGYIPPAAFHKGKYNLNHYIASYDAEIRYTDFYVGKLLENLNDINNTLIILTADHGESLGEHNTYFTHQNIYDEILHIPLIIKDTRLFRGGKKISTVASSVDIVPTILSRVNPIWYFFNKDQFNGIDLKSILKDQAIKRKYIYSYFPWSWGIRNVKNNTKYILNLKGEEELYFLPDEYTNRANDDSSDVALIKEKLRQELKTWLKHYPIHANINVEIAPVDEKTTNELRSLGYVQ